MITGYNSKEIGNQTLTVTYQGLTQEFIVNVKDYIAKLEIEKPKKISRFIKNGRMEARKIQSYIKKYGH